MEIKVTQYIRPHGNTRAMKTTLPDDMKPHVEAMESLGYQFGSEVVGKLVVLYIEHKLTGRNIATDLASNGPMVQEVMARMLREAFKLPAQPA